MLEIPSGVIPAVRRMNDFEKALKTTCNQIVLLETRLAMLKYLVTYAKRENKSVFIHFDLIQGLKADSYGMEYVIREVKPDGILSTRGNIITLAKKYDVLAIQRMFLLDSAALDQNLKLVERFKPDCVEVLPGLMPSIIDRVHQTTNIPVIAGGLITSQEDVRSALDNGAIAVSTSNVDLWNVD